MRVGLAALMFALAASVLQNSGFAGDEPNYGHLLRMQMSFTFDGEPVEFDDTIYCGVREKGTLTSRPSKYLTPSHGNLWRQTRDGGIIRLTLNRDVCYLYGSKWNPQADPAKELRPPKEGWLPEVSWSDAKEREDRTITIFYVSETSLRLPGGRLQLVSPMEFSIPYHPPRTEDIEAAYRAAGVANRLYKTGTSPESRMIAITEPEWRKTVALNFAGKPFKDDRDFRPAELFALLESYDPDLPIQFLNPLFDQRTWLRRTLGLAYSSNRMMMTLAANFAKEGLPQRNAERSGRLTKTHLPPSWADRVQPLICTEDGRVVAPDPVLRGVMVFRKDRCASRRENRWLELGGQLVPQPQGARALFFYDPPTRVLYYILRA